MAIERALIVDDSKSARVMLCRILEKKGLTVDLVESADGAYEQLANHVHPDVIFMDHMMPGTDGLTATRRISKEISTRNIPIVMYTSKEDPAYLEKALSAGALGVLPKPAKSSMVDTILSAVGESVANRVASPASSNEELAAREVSRTIEPIVASVDIAPKKSAPESAAEPEDAPSSMPTDLPFEENSEAFCGLIHKKVRELVFDSVKTMVESKLIAYRAEMTTQLQKTASTEVELQVQKVQKGIEEQITKQIEAAIPEVESKEAQLLEPASDNGKEGDHSASNNEAAGNKNINGAGIPDDVASSIRQSAENAAKLAASEIATNAAGGVASSVIEQQMPTITKEVLRELKSNSELIAAISGSIERPTMEPTVKAMEAEMAEMRKQLWELDAAVSADHGSSHDHPELRTSILESKSDLRGSIKSVQIISTIGAFLAGTAIAMQLLGGVL